MEGSGGHYGNLGIDMTIDRLRRIWILEANRRNPDHSIAVDAGNVDMYRRCLLANLLYCKRLSGFIEE